MMLVGLAPYSAAKSSGSSCYDIKAAYQGSACCGTDLQKTTSYTIAAPPPPPMKMGPNMCAGKKPYHADPSKKDYYFKNVNCSVDGVLQVLEQAGANVTKGYKGLLDATGRTPITEPYWKAGLCPVNVHWHLGAEHLSVGEYDESGKGPTAEKTGRKLMAGAVRQGFQCKKY